VDCRLMDFSTNDHRFNPGERWLLMLYDTRLGYIDVFARGMWKVNGNEVQKFDPDKRGDRQDLVSKITGSLDSTKPLTWDQVHSIAALGTPEKVVPIIRQRGVGFVMTPEMRQRIGLRGTEIIQAIETSRR